MLVVVVDGCCASGCSPLRPAAQLAFAARADRRRLLLGVFNAYRKRQWALARRAGKLRRHMCLRLLSRSWGLWIQKAVRPPRRSMCTALPADAAWFVACRTRHAAHLSATSNACSARGSPSYAAAACWLCGCSASGWWRLRC